MAQLNFGGVIENVMTREEFPLEKAREVLKDETIAVIGYGVQGPGQSLNLRDNGFNVIVGQRQGKTYDKAVADGWVPGETLFSIEEACQKATIIMCLLSDAAVISVWPTIKPCLTAGKALYFSHGFAITWNDRTGVVPPTDVDVIMVAPKGSGTSLRTMFLEGRGLNSSYAIYQDATGKALDRTLALGIGIGSGENRAVEAVDGAIHSALLEMSIDGAQSILLNVTGGPDVSLYEINEAAEKVAEAVDPEANIIFGSVIDPDMEDSIRITVVATGFGKEPSSIPSFGQGTGGTTKSGDKKDSAGGVEIPAWMR